MDYEEYYNGLITEVERTTVVLKEYNDLEADFAGTVSNRVTYESYVLSSMPIGIADIVYILTSGNMSIKFDIELKNTLKNNTRLLYTKGLLELMKNNKTRVLEIFKSLVDISNREALINLKNDISSDLTKNEYRLSRLKDLLRR